MPGRVACGLMASYSIRLVGDPVLRQIAQPVENIDGKLATVAADMLDAMYAAPGVGLAAPQVGIQKRFFVYDIGEGEGPKTLINPVVVESRGEWSYDEGCLSVPDMSFEIVRPKEIHITGFDLDGNEVSLEADEFEARMFLHEIDHLDGKLLIDMLEDDQRRAAMKVLRQRAMGEEPTVPERKGLRLRLRP